VAQYEMNLRDYWLIVRRRRTWIIATTVATMLFSLWLARQKVPVYQATATVKFEQATNLSGLLVEVLSYSSSDSIETQATLIKSYPVLEEVARRLGRLPAGGGDTAVRESRGHPALERVRRFDDVVIDRDDGVVALGTRGFRQPRDGAAFRSREALLGLQLLDRDGHGYASTSGSARTSDRTTPCQYTGAARSTSDALSCFWCSGAMPEPLSATEM